MRKILFILFLIFFNSNLFAKTLPAGSSSAQYPANIMIMLDISGSMSGYVPEIGLRNPVDVKIDSAGNIYALEQYGTVEKFNSSGTYQATTYPIGQRVNAACPYATYLSYYFDIYNDEIYLADYYNRRVNVYSTSGECLRSIVLNPSIYPVGIAVSANYMYITTGWGSELFTFNKTSGTLINRFIPNNDYRNQLFGVALNSNKTKLVAINRPTTSNNQAYIFNISGSSLNLSAGHGYSSYSCAIGGRYGYPQAAVFDTSDNIFIADPGCGYVSKISSSGNYINRFAFYGANGIGIDSNNNLYLPNYNNNLVYKYNSNYILLSSFGGVISAGTTYMALAKKVIKSLVSDPTLNKGANFGFVAWDGNYYPRVPITSNGANIINRHIDSEYPQGGTLLGNAVSKVATYWRSGGSFQNTIDPTRSTYFSSPIIAQDCQTNLNIIISDGYWWDSSQADRELNNLSSSFPRVKSIIVGLNSTQAGVNYNSAAIAGEYPENRSKTPAPTPFFASNEATLLEYLRTEILKSITDVQVGTSPVLSEVSSKGYIYQTSFSYKKAAQWQGNLKKYNANTKAASGSDLIGTEAWVGGAAKVLESKSSSQRQLWTVSDGLPFSLNNFTTTYVSLFRNIFSKTYPTAISNDTAASKLIQFVRGVDSYGEISSNTSLDRPNKLADIYNSQPVVVSPISDNELIALTTQDTSYSDNTYRSVNGYKNFIEGFNCGNQCKQKEEIILAGSNLGILHAFSGATGEELWGFIPPSMLDKLPAVIATGSSNSSNAIYGVDGSPVVKDIFYNNSWRTIAIAGLGLGGKSFFALDITNPRLPKHLFTIENTSSLINIWNENGNLTVVPHSFTSSEFYYRKLAFTTSTPRILRMKINNINKWVAVMGAGNSSNDSTIGSAVFVIDLENGGKLLKTIDINDKTTNSIANFVPSDVALVTANTTSNAKFTGAMAYVADVEGKITKINLTDQNPATLYSQTQLFDSEYLPDTVLGSSQNNRKNFTGLETAIIDGQLWLFYGTGDLEKIQIRDDNIHKNRLFGIKDEASLNNIIFQTTSSKTAANCTNAGNIGTCPGINNIGWYYDLPNSQRLTDRPTFSNNYLYFSTYEPPSGFACTWGNASLLVREAKCGQQAKLYLLGTGVANQATVAGNKVVVSLSGKAAGSTTGQSKINDNLIVIDQEGTSQSQEPLIEAWREN